MYGVITGCAIWFWTAPPDGSSIGTSMVSWVATPHFWSLEKLIVLYVGENEDIIDSLEYVLVNPEVIELS